jgi:hypothetical protein
LAVLRQLSRAEVMEPWRMQRIAKDGRIGISIYTI